MAGAASLEDHLRRLVCCCLLLLPVMAVAELHVVIVQGLGGHQDFNDAFDRQVAQLTRSAQALTGAERVRVFAAEDARREPVLRHLESLQQLGSDDRIALFLVGHGSYDGFEYKFNLPGPDLTGADLKTALEGLKLGAQLLVNTSSASGALLEPLQREGRIVITATRSGGERHATRFGGYFFAALGDSAADINKNGTISAQEAFDYAERQVADWFEVEGRLATEHAKLVGERAGQFTLARLSPDITAPDSPERARLMKERDAVDDGIQMLQLQRDSMESGDYFDQLERLMLDLALVQEQIDALDRDEADD
jgi:hypothetical protein